MSKAWRVYTLMLGVKLEVLNLSSLFQAFNRVQAHMINLLVPQHLDALTRQCLS